jgi:methylase of polypeptide subunit release factors
MNIAQIEQNLQQLISDFDKATPTNFIYDLLQIYDTPKSTIKRLQDGGLNLSKIEGEVAWKKQLFFKTLQNEDLYELFERIKTNERATKHSPRFVLLTNYEKLLALDTKTTDSLDIALTDLPRHFDFFLPWAGMEKAQVQYENPADVKAAERMARLYDEIRKDNPVLGDSITEQKEDIHNLNVFLSRLLFCFFAEDTGIFEKGIFTNSISSHTQTDGSDLHTYLDRLFEVLNTSDAQRSLSMRSVSVAEQLRSVSVAELPAYLLAFPYVNGGLFRNSHQAPIFSRRSRQILIESGELDWSAINPDIFGSMIQAVITPEHRGGLGMHYTSVPNIMKVIEPLFLDELYETFEAAVDAAAKGNASTSSAQVIKKLNELLKRLWNIKIFDPACGSGNFLIIAYKELRKLEMAIFKEIDRINQSFSTQFSGIHLGNFYGIELDDFAHEVATLSLWLAEHQMNQSFFKEFGRTRPALPLKETGNIVHGNACRVDWESVCPKNDASTASTSLSDRSEQNEIYILGNPPYLGSSMQSAEQKDDMALVFKGIDGYKNLDYIAAWFLKGANFIQNQNAQFAFVSTNSICQGEQVALLWQHIFKKNLEIGFAHTSFKWANNAKANAGVTVIIVGLRNDFNKTQKVLFVENRKIFVNNINAYLAQGKNIIIERRSESISRFPKMTYGNKPVDGGNLILNTDEKNKLLEENPKALKFIKKLTGSHEYISQSERWCLWILDEDLDEANLIDEIKKRIDAVKKMRLESRDLGTIKMADNAHQFREMNVTTTQSVIIPSHSSENRDYIPFGFLDSETVINNSAFAIYDSPTHIFSILTSRIHMTWIRAVAGNLETRIRYSSSLCYNTFPFPPISERQKQELEQSVYRILEEREAHSEKSLAQLYDPDRMPEGLRTAHRQNDLAVERCYRSKPFESDEERLEYLFKLYELMIAEEKTRGTLFEKEKKSKPRIKQIK